ncbi:MAG: protein kinase [Bryobacteraceae bacterium]
MGDPCASEGLNAGQWDRIREILESALGLASDLRAAYLAEACAGDAALLSEVESLIAASERSALLDHAPLASLAPTITLTATAAGRTIGNYKVVDRIGEGGMGTVYQAVDPRLGRTVALKVISRLGGAADEKRRFFREAKAASALNHPNIVTIYEYDSDHEVDFIAMEYIRGATLHALLAERRLPIQTLLEYAVQASGAVAAAHAAGIIHRDLKPNNIMVTDTGIVKVLDFGLAKQAGSDIDVTRAGATLGTPAYMSPEQARGEPADARSDIFSFGIILYEIACGRRPFHGVDLPSTLYAVVHEVPPPPDELNPTVPKSLASVIERCLRKNKEERPQSMESVRADLSAVLQQLRDGGPARREMPRRKLMVGAVLAAAAIAAGIWLPRLHHQLTFTWTILAQQMQGGQPLGEEYVASPADTFQAGWRFHFRVQSPQPGFFYLIDHGPGADGTEKLWILYPRNSAATAGQQLVTGWYVFDQNPGTERLWVVWSEHPLDPIRSAPRDLAGEVRDPSAIQRILDYLTRLPRVSSTSTRDGVQLRAAGDVLGVPLGLRHQ